MSPPEWKNKIRGPIRLSVTPFDENEGLDEKALRHSVRHVADSLAGEEPAFLVNGSTREFYAMNDEDWKRTARALIEEVDGNACRWPDCPRTFGLATSNLFGSRIPGGN